MTLTKPALNELIGHDVTVSFKDGTSAKGKLLKKPCADIYRLDLSYGNPEFRGATFDFTPNSIDDIE